MLFRYLVIHLNYEESKLFHILVRKDTELVLFRVVNDLFDRVDLEVICQLPFLACLHIDMLDLIGRCNQEYLLIKSGFEERWLTLERLLKLVECLHLWLFIHEIELKNFIEFGEDDCVILAIGLEEEVHADLTESWKLTNNDSLVQLKLVQHSFWLRNALKDKQLVRELLVHNEQLA